MINNCTVCQRKISKNDIRYTNSLDTCILHCKKNTWYIEKNEQKDWTKSNNAVIYFWEEVRKIILNKDKDLDYQSGSSLDFRNIIFPIFEKSDDEIEEYDEGIIQCIDWHDNFYDMQNIDSEYPKYESDIRFNFSNSVFLDDIDLSDYKFNGIVNFDNVNFHGECRFNKTKFNQVSFNNTNFHKKVIFKDSVISFYSYQLGDFDKSIFYDEVEFINTTIGFEKSTKEFDIDFKGTQFHKQVTFISCTFNKGLRFFKDTQSKQLNIQNTNIQYLYIAGNIRVIIVNGNRKVFDKLITFLCSKITQLHV